MCNHFRWLLYIFINGLLDAAIKNELNLLPDSLPILYSISYCCALLIALICHKQIEAAARTVTETERGKERREGWRGGCVASQDASQSLLACWPSCGCRGPRYALPRSVCRANCKLNKANELQSVRTREGGGREKGEEERRG